MSGDAHVRICESLGVQFPRATRLFVRINGETHYLWRDVDHEGEVLEVFATKRRDRKAALKFLKRTMRRYGLWFVKIPCAAETLANGPSAG